MEKKKISTKTIVIIVICIVLLLTLIGGGVYWYIFVLNADKNSPEEVLTQYVSYINEKDFESMYTLLSDSTKTRRCVHAVVLFQRHPHLHPAD